MKKATKLLALLLALCMIASLAACGSSSSTTTSSTTSTTSTTTEDDADTTSDTLEIVLDLDGEPSTLNAALIGGTTSANLTAKTCYGFLWRVTSDDSIVMDLAESYELDEENLLLTVYLREGLMFADGSALTSADIVFTLQNEASDNGAQTGDIDFDRLVAVDDTTIEIGLKNLNAGLLADLGEIGIMSKEYTEDGTNDTKKSAEILCSGPYIIESWTTGNNIVLNKNPYYWNAENVIYDKITLKCISDETTRFLDYCAGGVDVCLLSDSANIESVQSGSAVGTVDIVAIQSVQGIFFDTENVDTFVNENNRLALCYATDCETLVAAYCGDLYTVATSSFPSTSSFYIAANYEYDLETAQAYLAAYYEETGTSSFEFTITVESGSIGANIAQALQYQYETLLEGVSVNVNIVDSSTYSDLRTLGELYCAIGAISRGFYDASKLVNSWRSTSANSIMHMGYLEDLNTMLEDCLTNSSYTTAERLAAIQDLQIALRDAGKFIPIYEEIACFALNGAVETVEGCLTGNGKFSVDFWTNLG